MCVYLVNSSRNCTKPTSQYAQTNPSLYLKQEVREVCSTACMHYRLSWLSVLGCLINYRALAADSGGGKIFFMLILTDFPSKYFLHLVSCVIITLYLRKKRELDRFYMAKKLWDPQNNTRRCHKLPRLRYPHSNHIGCNSNMFCPLNQ